MFFTKMSYPSINPAKYEENYSSLTGFL